MPFGISWGSYLKMWGVGTAGYAIGSQIVHSIYKPLENVDDLLAQEVERLREERGLKPPNMEEKLEKVLELDKEYVEKFGIKLEK